MAKKTTRKRTPKVIELSKPVLVQVGKSFIDPLDVAGIFKIRSIAGLYIVRMKSNPSPQFPFWAKEHELSELLKHFTIERTTQAPVPVNHEGGVDIDE